MEENAYLVETSSPLSYFTSECCQAADALVCLYLKRRDHECSQQPGHQHDIVHVAYIFIYNNYIHYIYQKIDIDKIFLKDKG